MTVEAKKRKETPVFSGVLNYFPDAIRAVAEVSFVGNEQHNPGSELHWDRNKSQDELDALSRHLIDAGTIDSDGLRHSAKVAWRALANLQKEIEREELKLQDWQEEVIARDKEGYEHIHNFGDATVTVNRIGIQDPYDFDDEPPIGSVKADLLDIERERRMNIIGQNGNTGEHYWALNTHPLQD